MPSELTSSVSSGIARYSGGLAGLAKCNTPSTRPSTGNLVARRRRRRSSKPGCSARCATFSQPARREVVDRDDLVAAREQRVAEMRSDEARDPPVTTIRPSIGARRRGRRSRAGASRPGRAGCGRRRSPRRASASRTRSKSSQRNSSHSVSSATTSAPAGGVVRVGAQRRARGSGRAAGSPAAGSYAAHDRALLEQRARDDERRRVAQIVGVGLEREAPERRRSTPASVPPTAARTLSTMRSCWAALTSTTPASSSKS